jgi:phosphatidylserine/phosphatidylglycerophosphate/cardiolipin synthase-like enzyme
VKKYKNFFSLLVVAAFYLWLIHAATTHTLPSESNPVIFYSNQQRQDLKLTLCRALKEATNSITLEMYALTDPDILKILKKSMNSKIVLKILYDKSASPNLKPIGGTPSSGKGLMHRKIVVIDHSLVFLGSANMTTQSMRFHDNLTLGFFHPELACFLEQEVKDNHFTFYIQDQKAELFLLPDLKGDAIKKLINTIDTAKEKIQIAIFTITHPLLTKALINAKERGVRVEVAVDFFTERGASQKTIQKLVDADIPIYCSQGHQLLHHKWAYIDESTLIIGSANWTQAAFAKNKDCFLILSLLTEKQKKTMKNLWRTIQLESELKNLSH